MQTDAFHWVKCNSLTSLYLLLISTRFILIVDTTTTMIPNPNRQMCTKIQSMLSFGKYQTYSMSSNITYVPRLYAQTFLAYSSVDNILLFIEPKHQLYVYNAQTIRLIVNITAGNMVYATSFPSLTTDYRHDLFFIYESRIKPKLVAIRVCQVRFNAFKLDFDETKCIETLKISCDLPDIRINGFTIKRDHAETKKSLLFVSTDIGLIYAIFNTTTGLLIRSPSVLNDTFHEGSVVVTSSGIIYYANKQEHTVHEIHVTRDFRIRYGKIIKSTAIKFPYGLIADECNHLYIATKSMILIMFMEKYLTIRSVFSKASDLPITIERLNATTYIYPTVKKYSTKTTPIWMFNFLSFNEPEKPVTTRMPVVNPSETSDVDHTHTQTTHVTEVLAISETTHEVLTHSTSTMLNERQITSSADNVHTTTNLPELLTSENEETLSLDESTQIQTTSASSSSESTLNIELTTKHTDNDLQTSPPSTVLNVIVDDSLDGIEVVSDDVDDTTSIDTTILSTEVSDRYSETDDGKFTFTSSLSTEVSTYSQTSTSTSLETTPVTSKFDLPSSTSSSSETSSTTHSTASSYESSTVLTQITMLFLNIINDHTSIHWLSTELTSTSLETISTENQPHLTTNTAPTPISITKEMEDETSEKYTASMLVEVNVSPTLNSSLSSFEFSSTYLTPSSSPPSPASPHPSLVHSSTTTTKLNQLLSSKYFSVTTATASTPSPTSSLSISTLQTTDSATTSDTTEQSSTMISSDESSPLLTTYPDETSLFTYATSSEYISTDDTTAVDPTTSQTDELSTTIDDTTTVDPTTSQTDELSTTIDDTTTVDPTTSQTDELSTTIDDTTTFDSSTSQTDELSTTLDDTTTVDYTTSQTTDELSTDNEEELTTTDFLLFETTALPSTTEEPTTEHTSTETSPETTPMSQTEYSTVVVTPSKPQANRLPRRRTSRPTTISTTTTTTTTVSDRKSSSTTTSTTSTAEIQTTAFYHPLSTSLWPSLLSSLQPHQKIVFLKPSFDANSSNTLISNELFRTLFNSTTNSSEEKLIYINLMDLPPSSWNVSFNTNQSVFLNILLPPATYPQNLSVTTNLTFTNVDANRFSTNIVGVPINLQVDQIQTKQFSLAMNLTNDQLNQSTSDVVIGHIKSEQFELNITKSDNMNLHVQQVDSETAELFFDSKFCTNESNLQINLNLSKNGTIRYGNQAPIRIGAVFTRVHMLKQSCELDQPFTLFFDICQGENPCLNGGTCQSTTPDYDDPSFSQKDSSSINYVCTCPIRTSGEHCQYSSYPMGYCINGGTLLSTFDSHNQSIDQCLCTEGFQGEHCEINIDDCIDIHCSKHGVCEDGIQTYTCSCFDGYFGSQCEQRNVETVLLQVASKSFASVAILLIAGIAGLFVVSDIHTYLTRRKSNKPTYRWDRLPPGPSEIFENSVLLLGFGDAPIELSDLSTIDRSRKSTTTSLPARRPVRRKKDQARYHPLSERRYTRTLEKPSSKRSYFSSLSYETIL